MPAGRVKVPVPLYGGVPPVAVTVMVDMPPLHPMGVAVADAAQGGGSGMVMVVEPTHPFAEVTVKVCVPALRVNVPVPVYCPDPPFAEIVTLELPPLQ